MPQSKLVTTIALVGIGILLITGIAWYSNRNVEPAQTATDTTTGTTDTNTVPASPYKDGTYTATGNYVSPGGRQALSVTVTLAGGVVTTLTVTPGAEDEGSKNYQGKFIGGVSGQVVGKSIDSLSVGVVSGSSLTAGGFNDAIAKIKTEARS